MGECKIWKTDVTTQALSQTPRPKCAYLHIYAFVQARCSDHERASSGVMCGCSCLQHCSFLGRFYFHWVALCNSESNIGLAFRYMDSHVLLPCFKYCECLSNLALCLSSCKRQRQFPFPLACSSFHVCPIAVVLGTSPWRVHADPQAASPWTGNKDSSCSHPFQPRFMDPLRAILHFCLFHVFRLPFQKEKKSEKNYFIRQSMNETVHFSVIKKQLKSENNRKRSHRKVFSMENFKTIKVYEKDPTVHFMTGGEWYY